MTPNELQFPITVVLFVVGLVFAAVGGFAALDALSALDGESDGGVEFRRRLRDAVLFSALSDLAFAAWLFVVLVLR